MVVPTPRGAQDLAHVTLGPDLSLEQALRELKHRVGRAQLREEVWRRRFARSRGQARRAKDRRAATRARKAAVRAAAAGAAPA
jgi:ribosomal protein S21